MHGRIDIHHHVVPEFYREWLSAKCRAGIPHPPWTVEASLAAMDLAGTATAIVMPTAPGAVLGTLAENREIARRLNEFAADLARTHAGRFGFFATLPLPDLEGALAELEYALDGLGADGVLLLGNADGIPLGDPSLEPLFAELQRRGAVVFVHPTVLPGGFPPDLPPFVADYMLDTVRAALSLARAGTLERCPDVDFILAHGGGFLPYAAARLSAFAGGKAGIERGYELLQRFHLDIALSTSAFQLPALLQWARSESLLYGSDFPATGAQQGVAFTSALEQTEGVDHEAVDRLNAERLFPRLRECGAGRRG